MAFPNFSLRATIDKHLRGVTLTQHTVNNCMMPTEVSRQVLAGRRIWTLGDYNHAANVVVRGYGVFELRWNNDSVAVESVNRRWLAEQVYFFKMRSEYIEQAA